MEENGKSSLMNKKVEFQNKSPEYAIIQLSKNNIFKNATLWILLFISQFTFGFLVGYIPKGKLDYNIVNLDLAISLWGFIGFVLVFWFLSYSRRYKYLLSLANYLHNIILIFSFTLFYMLYKLNVFGSIDNSANHANESIKAIKILFYLWNSIMLLVILSWYFFILRSRKKHWHLFFKTSILISPLVLYLFSPFLIMNFNSTYITEKETFFLIISLLLIICFSMLIGFLGKYQTFGQNNLKIVNKVLGYELSYASLGGAFGAISYQIYLTSEYLSFSKFFIISLVLSFVMLFMFIGFILRSNKKDKNSFLNKIMLKVFIISNLLIAIIMAYLAPINDGEAKHAKSLEVVIPPFLSILIFYVIISIIFKLVVFERWPLLTKLFNFLLSFFFVIFQGVIGSLEDAKILYKWLGRTLVIIIIGFYTFIEIASFSPDLFIVLKSMKKTANLKKTILKKEIKNA